MVSQFPLQIGKWIVNLRNGDMETDKPFFRSLYYDIFTTANLKVQGVQIKFFTLCLAFRKVIYFIHENIY